MSKEKAQILSKEDQLLKDGLENLVAELGTERDKRSSSRFVNSKRLSMEGMQDELNAMYRTDWLSGKVVDIIPNDMTRNWRSFDGEIKPEIVKMLEDEESRIELRSAFNEAHKWARLYGTAFIVMSIDDGNTPERPLNIDAIKKGGLKHIKVVDRHRISNADVTPIADPFNPSFGFPEFYRMNETSIKIHHSRVIRFDGVKLPWDEFRRNNYYSDSVLDRLYDAITNLNTATDSSASMIYETNVDIIKVEGLMSYLQTADGENLLRKRFALASMVKSFNNMMLLDNKEGYQNKTNSFASLPDLIDRFAQVVSAGSDVPATRLLGSSASGLNATGEGDLKNYYDKISADQITEYKPRLDVFDIIMAKSLGLPDDIDLSYEFNSLFQMTPKEQAEVDFNNAQRDQIYLLNDVVDEVTVAKELKQNGTYTNITAKYIKELEALVNEDDEDDNNDDLITDPDDSENESEEGKGKNKNEES